MTITLKDMVVLLVNNDPIEVYQTLLNSDDAFREFIEKNKDKSTTEMIEQFNLNIIRESEGHA